MAFIHKIKCITKHVCMIFLFLTLSLSCSLVKPQIIPDKNLADAVRQELGLASNESILEEDLKELEQLIVVGREIKKLNGLEKAVGLKYLLLDRNNIKNIKPIGNLKQLTYLSLGNNEIRNIKPIANLNGLKMLSLSINPIDNITPVTMLKQLTT